jgi:ankyrin repeat protein
LLISAKREDMAVKVINALLDAYPKAIKVDSEGGRLPLHTACAGRATPRVISTLVSAYPAAARHRNKDGFLPIHLAAHWGVSHPNVAITLLKAYPDSTWGRNRWERTPLEEALCMAGENGRPHQAALVRCLRKHPSYWTQKNQEEELFRSGARVGSTLVDIDETIADDDTSTTDTGNGGNAGAASGRGGQNLATMDLGALIKIQNWDAILERLETNPHAAGENLNAMMKGGYVATSGCTPLHFACERQPPVEVVAALIAAWPEAVTTPVEPGGLLPLHLACTWHTPTDSIAVLVQADPATCRITDDLGNLALHHAAFSGAEVATVDCLLRTYPKAVLARNHQGSLPYDIVKRLRNNNRRNVLALLSTRRDEVMTVQHRRTQSTGSATSLAQRAMAMNLQ